MKIQRKNKKVKKNEKNIKKDFTNEKISGMIHNTRGKKKSLCEVSLKNNK